MNFNFIFVGIFLLCIGVPHKGLAQEGINHIGNIGSHLSPVAIPKHLEYARELVATVTPNNNKYSFTGPYGVRWKDGLFTNENKVNTMCTGLVSAVLEKAGSKSVSEVEQKTRWRKYLRIENYYEAIEKGYGFSKIETVYNLQPGDIFIYKCNQPCSTSQGEAQGHIMIIDAIPKKHSPTPPILANTEQWIFTIIDSADRAHDRNDTRWVPKDAEQRITGVGRGHIRVYTDAQGLPVAFGNGLGAHIFDRETRPVLWARPKN